MLNAEDNLLTASKYKQCLNAVESAKHELIKLTKTHAVMSKYMSCHWYQQALQTTATQLNITYKQLAETIECYEQIIEDNRRLLYLHTNAVEALKESNLGLLKINISQVTLVQQNLF